MRAQEIRCQSDTELFERLIQDRLIVLANEELSHHEEAHPSKLRRRLLATSLRLSSTMAPEIHAVAAACKEVLEVDISLELYVFPDPQFNAVCFKPEDDRLFIMFSSSLLEGFDLKELKFVLGHEMGHHIYNHHAIPIGFLLRSKKAKAIDPQTVLELFAWSRYAEISADRAGMHCCGDIRGAARALFKLASGLTGKAIQIHTDDFLAQIEDMTATTAGPGSGSSEEDWFTTHPFSPLRLKALKLFDDSVYQKEEGMGMGELEASVQGLMSMMEPSYTEGKTESAIHMSRMLYAGAIAVAAASDGISEEEVKVFEGLFGEGEFSSHLDIDRIIDDLASRIEKACHYTSVIQRMQVLRDLCLVAAASGEITVEERKVLRSIAHDAGVSWGFVNKTLAQQVIPD